jgi:hypothetical protein
MQLKAWMTTLLFKKELSFIQRSIPSGISLTNRHLLILNRHGSHVTLVTIKQVKKFGLYMITLPLHTSLHFNPWMWLASSLSRLLLKRKEIQQ